MSAVAIKLKVTCHGHVVQEEHEIDAEDAAKFLELYSKYGADEETLGAGERECVELFVKNYVELYR
jgi:hypothetical protein